jgi:P-type conjugative transfer protein TrbL
MKTSYLSQQSLDQLQPLAPDSHALAKPMTDQNILNNLLNTLAGAFQTYEPQLLIIGVALLSVLVFIQFFYIAVDVAVNHDLPHMLDTLAIALIKLGIVYVIMNHVYGWGNAIINTGIQIGQQVSGQSPNVLTPSGIWQLGLNLVGILYSAKAAGGFLHPVMDIEFFVTAAAVALAWLFAALLYLLLLLEATVALVLGPIFVALGGLESTGEALAAWAKTLVAIALGIIALLLAVAAGLVLVQGWATQLQAVKATLTTDSTWLILAVAESIAFFYIVKHIASMSQSMIGRSAGALAGAVLGGIGAAAGGAASAARGALGGGSGGNQNASSSGQHAGPYMDTMPPANPDALSQSDKQLLGIEDSSTAPTVPLANP